MNAVAEEKKTKPARVLPCSNEYPKVAFAADFHALVHKYKRDHIGDVVAALETFGRLCVAERVDFAVILGDLFDEKTRVATEALNLIGTAIAGIAENTRLYIVPGNHDMVQYGRPELNLAFNYSFFDNVDVVSEPTLFLCGPRTGVLMAPYSRDPLASISSARENVEFLVEKGLDVVMMSHFGVKGFTLNPTCSEAADADDDAVPISALSVFSRVFLGHYHGAQALENVRYVSSPLQLRHGDEAMDHGFYVWDAGDESASRFVAYDGGPRHLTVRGDKSGILQAMSAPRSNVRVVLEKALPSETLFKLRKALAERHDKVSFDDSAVRASAPRLVALEEFQASGYRDVSKVLDGYLERAFAVGGTPKDITKDELSAALAAIME